MAIVLLGRDDLRQADFVTHQWKMGEYPETWSPCGRTWRARSLSARTGGPPAGRKPLGGTKPADGLFGECLPTRPRALTSQDHQLLRLVTSAVSCGATWKRSPTTP